MSGNPDLSEREQDILKLVATGVSNKEIARKLHISTNTVKVHLRNIFSKIGVFSRTEATLYAIEHGIVESPGNLGEQTPARSPLQRWAIPGSMILIVIVMLASAWYWLRNRNNQISAIQTLTANPVTNPTSIPRWQDHAGLPNGRAGMAATVYEDQIFLFAGETEEGITNSNLRYDVQTDGWQSIASKPTAVTDIQGIMLGEKIYLPGGWTGSSAISTLEVYDPRMNIWEEKAPLPEPRSGYAVASYEGKLYLFGGWDGQKVNDTIFVYNPLIDQWSEMNPMPAARGYMGAVTVGNKIYLLGGWDGTDDLSINEIYYPNRDQTGDKAWYKGASLPIPVCHPATTEIVNSIYVIGGSDDDCSLPLGSTGSTDSEEVMFLQYITQQDTWNILVEVPKGLNTGSVLVTYNDYLFNFGGVRLNQYSAFSRSYQAIFSTSIPVIIVPQ